MQVPHSHACSKSFSRITSRDSDLPICQVDLPNSQAARTTKSQKQRLCHHWRPLTTAILLHSHARKWGKVNPRFSGQGTRALSLCCFVLFGLVWFGLVLFCPLHNGCTNHSSPDASKNASSAFQSSSFFLSHHHLLKKEPTFRRCTGRRTHMLGNRKHDRKCCISNRKSKTNNRHASHFDVSFLSPMPWTECLHTPSHGVFSPLPT